MKVQISALNNLQMDWAVGQIDSRCEGFNWKVQDGIVVGTCDVENKDTVAIFLAPNHAFNIIKIRRMFKDGEHFSPSTNWANGGRFMDEWKPNLKWMDNDEICVATIFHNGGPHIGVGKTTLEAVILSKLTSIFGEEIEMPDNIYQATKTQ